ncbi:Hypothetical protein NTJ_13680 [Nesidiocoris tenuis]|uniref:Coiled-coil domain-containing protein n=1 Tax=Nesidiocoris tenuis TaxID=355587 RepID=A0ABN7B996_9HEMI|nr:Hypothetical protein NTJ_13680 [Nesidiocoris tenuis]
MREDGDESQNTKQISKQKKSPSSADERKSWHGQRFALSPTSSVKSGNSTSSLPSRVPELSSEERKRMNEEAFNAWKRNKCKIEIEKKKKAKEEEERLQREKKEKEENVKKHVAENRTRWLQAKQAQAEAAKRKKHEAQMQIKQDQEEKRQLSKEMVSTWLAVARNRSRPCKGGVFDVPRIKYVNPQPWQGILND